MPWGRGAVAGGFVFLSGLEGAVDDEGGHVEGIEAQTRLALDRGQRDLEAAGSHFELVVRLTQYLAAAADSPGFHRARDAWLAEHAPMLLEEQSYGGVLVIVGFTDPKRRVELEVTAALSAR